MRRDGVSEQNLMKGLVLYPTAYSEFEIQSYLYSELIKLGVDVRGEVRAKNVSGSNNRMDLVIFKKKIPVMIIEVKKSRQSSILAQKIEYGRFNIPMRFILGMDSAKAYIKKVRNRITNTVPQGAFWGGGEKAGCSE